MSIAIWTNYTCIFKISALVTYLAAVHDVRFPPNEYWYCNMADMAVFSAFLCITTLLVAMTFDRFYSIIRPHKAASFNTIKRAKITIVCVVTFSIIYNIPHLFISDHDQWQFVPYGKAIDKSYGQFYYWSSFVLNYALPFRAALSNEQCYNSQNSLRKKINWTKIRADETKIKSSDGQIYAILLLVTFGFLILVTPAYMFFLFVMLVDFFASPHRLAGYHLFYNVAHKLQTTNHGINFFFYVISRQKFRTDLMHLFRTRNRAEGSGSSSSLIENSSVKSKWPKWGGFQLLFC